MAEITVPAKKFGRVLDYIERIGLDAHAIAASVDLKLERIVVLDPDQALPALQYSRLYQAAAVQMQRLERTLPWGAGVGGEAFNLMCHCMITARTLREALVIAERFDKLLYPLNGYQVRLVDDPALPQARLSYTIKVLPEGEVLIPEDWELADYRTTVACASGLRTWYALCGWLIGRGLTADEVHIGAPAFNQEYHDGIVQVFNCPVYFDSRENFFSFDRGMLDRRLVHTTESLTEFLKNCVYHLIAVDQAPASTSAAIKSLVAISLPNGTPSFADVASMLYMSESSLRRRLQGEQTSYQAIKDEVRCEVAIEKLLYEDVRVADLAALLGFTETSSFVRSFKGWTGHTPKSYKDRMKSLAKV